MRLNSLLLWLIICMILAVLIGCGNTPGGGNYYTGSGKVTTLDGLLGLSGVRIIVSGGATGTATTDVNGIWSNSGLNGTVTITPSRLGFTFDPLNQSISSANSNINFKMTGFFDDFSNSLSGWPYSSCYKNSKYEISIQGGYYERSAPFKVSTNYSVQVDCQVNSGTGDAESSYGIMFNWANSSDFYYFCVAPFSRKYALFRVWNKINNTGNWIDSSYINATATGNNSLKVVKTGTQLDLWINDSKVETVTGNSFGGSQVGFGTVSTPLVVVDYDNFQYTAAN